jgi:hypothetical protein
MISSLVTPGQCVCNDVQAPRPKLDGEIVAEQLGDPLVLRQGGEALVEEELERIVIGAHDKATPP